MPESIKVTVPPSSDGNMNIPKSIAKALVALQAEVRAMGKTAQNDHFKNTYAPLDEVMDTALPLLTKHKLALIQWPTTVGNEHFLHSVLLHEDGESMQSDLRLLLTKQDPQGLGSAITYTRRQTVMAILGLSAKDEDDDGNKASNHFPPPNSDQLDYIKQMCSTLGFPSDDIKARIVRIRTADQAVVTINTLEKMLKQKADAIERRAHAKSIEVGEADEMPEPPKNTREQVEQRLSAFGFKDRTTINQFILTITKKPLIGNCKEPELQLLNEALDRLDSGEETFPADWLAEKKPSQGEESNG